MHKLRCYLAGQKYFGQEMLKMLSAMGGIDVVGVSAPFSPDDHEDRLWRLAGQLHIPRRTAGRLGKDDLPGNVDLIVAAHCHDFISPLALSKTKLGAIGYHPSLLPRHRGRDAIYWTIHTGDTVTGGTVYWLNDKVDGGPIAAQSHCLIRPGDTPYDLWIRELQPLGLLLIKKVLMDIQNGVINAVPQNEALSTWEPSFGRAPLFRPDLPMIGPAPEGFKVNVTRAALL
jgi:methionyl-tRNA formyltransferase